jgi:hypothetical protein
MVVGSSKRVACTAAPYVSIKFPFECGPCLHKRLLARRKRKLAAANAFRWKFAQEGTSIGDVSELIRHLEIQIGEEHWKDRTQFPVDRKQPLGKLEAGHKLTDQPWDKSKLNPEYWENFWKAFQNPELRMRLGRARCWPELCEHPEFLRRVEWDAQLRCQYGNVSKGGHGPEGQEEPAAINYDITHLIPGSDWIDELYPHEAGGAEEEVEGNDWPGFTGWDPGEGTTSTAAQQEPDDELVYLFHWVVELAAQEEECSSNVYTPDADWSDARSTADTDAPWMHMDDGTDFFQASRHYRNGPTELDKMRQSLAMSSKESDRTHHYTLLLQVRRLEAREMENRSSHPRNVPDPIFPTRVG